MIFCKHHGILYDCGDNLIDGAESQVETIL